MIGGTMKTTSRFALAAAAGLFVGAMAFTPAQAADLGGDCCADLEERVAELEATTARKGNRVVSLQVSGRVNRAMLIWDDGEESDVFFVDNDHSSSRLGFSGTGAMKPGWTAGYDVVFNVQEADSSAVSQADFDTNDSGKDVAFDIRRARVYLQSEQFGRITLGQGQAASDGTSEVDLGYGNYSNDTLYNSGFVLRGDAGADELTWGGLGFNLDGAGRTNNVRYDSPTIAGFILSTSYGEDDYYDVALRFSKEWNSVRFAAAAAYSKFEDDNPDAADDGPDVEIINGSFSVMHTPSGLFFTGAAAQRETDASTADIEGCADTHVVLDDACFDLQGGPDFGGEADEDRIGSTTALVDPDDATFYSAKLGVERNWTGYGNTTIFGLYAYFEDFATGSIVNGTFTENGAGGTNWSFDQVTSSEVDRYAFGINQNFASAATDIYLHLEYNEADLEVQEFTGVDDSDPTAGASRELDTEEWFGVVLGTRVRF